MPLTPNTYTDPETGQTHNRPVPTAVFNKAVTDAQSYTPTATANPAAQPKTYIQKNGRMLAVPSDTVNRNPNMDTGYSANPSKAPAIFEGGKMTGVTPTKTQQYNISRLSKTNVSQKFTPHIPPPATSPSPTTGGKAEKPVFPPAVPGATPSPAETTPPATPTATDQPSGFNMPENTPFASQADMAKQAANDAVSGATNTFTAEETARELQLRSQLSQLGIAGEGQNVLAATEKKLGKLSLPQLEQLATSNGIELSDANKAKIRAEGAPAIDNLKIAKDLKLAENQYTQSQMERSFNRAITDREQFNVQQDVKLRQMASAFGGGKYETTSTNIAVMHAQEQGQRTLDDLKAQYADNETLSGKETNAVIDTYTNNVNIIEGQMNSQIEDKYTALMNNVDTLINAGVKDKTDLETAIAGAKKDYMKSYFDITDKALKYTQDQNKMLQDHADKVAERNKYTIEKDDNGNLIAINPYTLESKVLGSGVTGTPNGTGVDNSGATPINDPTYKKLAANCVLYARAYVPNLPHGLFTKQDKMNAVLLNGDQNMSDVQVGDAVLTGEGTDGHVAIVSGINGTKLTLREANYKAGQITQGRTIDYSDPNMAKMIYGFVSPTRNAPMDSQVPGANALSFQNEGTNKAIFDVQGTSGAETGQKQFTPFQVAQFQKYGGEIPPNIKHPIDQQKYQQDFNTWSSQQGGNDDLLSLIKKFPTGATENKIASDLAYGKLTFGQFRTLYSYSRDIQKKQDIYGLASQLNPNFDPSAFELGYKFAENPKVRQQVASADNVINIMPSIIEESNNAARTGIPAINKVALKVGVLIGNKSYSNLGTAAVAFADELSGALGYGGATDMARQMGYDMTDTSQSPEVFASNMRDIVLPFIQNKKASLLGQMGIYGQIINNMPVESSQNNINYTPEKIKSLYTPDQLDTWNSKTPSGQVLLFRDGKPAYATEDEIKYTDIVYR